MPRRNTSRCNTQRAGAERQEFWSRECGGVIVIAERKSRMDAEDFSGPRDNQQEDDDECGWFPAPQVREGESGD